MAYCYVFYTRDISERLFVFVLIENSRTMFQKMNDPCDVTRPYLIFLGRIFLYFYRTVSVLT